MKIKRRHFIKGLAGAGAALATAPLATDKALAKEEAQNPKSDHIGMLYDATRCIGCKACEVSCKKANNMPIEYGKGKLADWDAPRDLSEKTLNIIKLYKGAGESSFVKRQCMHCIEPNCVSGCPTSALQKQDNGAVTWDKDACCGCRYCQMNCPYNIPKYEYNDAYGSIIKCQFCYSTNIPQRGQPACTEVCPADAVIFGKIKNLLADAKDRIKKYPDRYFKQVYGEKEGGGTSVLYLAKANVPFEKLGLPALPDYSNASVSEGIQHALYNKFIAPIVVYAGLAAIAFKNRSEHKED